MKKRSFTTREPERQTSKESLEETTARLRAENQALREQMALLTANSPTHQQKAQQAAVLEISMQALKEHDLATMAQFAAERVAAALDCELVQVLELEESKEQFVLRAGVGWANGMIGTASVPISANSHAGYALETRRPVYSSDLQGERRFTPSPILQSHHAKSGITVLIYGTDGQPYGILGAHSTQLQDFNQGDIAFLQQVATILAVTFQRFAVEVEREQIERRFRDLADNISQLAWTADADGWIFWYNRRWFEYTGTNFEDMQGWGWQSVHHKDYVETVTEKFKRHIVAGIPWEDTFPIRGRDGEYRWFLSRAMPIFNDDGSVRLWFGTNTDVTEQLRVEEELEESRRKLQAIIDNAPTAIYAKDRHGVYVLSNRTHAQMLECESGPVVGKTDADFVSSRQLKSDYANNDQAVWQSGEAIEFEERLVTDHTERIFISLKFPLRTADGEMYAVCGVSTDITERKANERHLHEVMAELNHRVKNTIAVIDAVASQTLRASKDLKQFEASFRERLHSIAAAHTLLTRTDWKGAELGAILRAELEPRVGSSEQLNFIGPDLVLEPKPALAVHMAVHELATNAAKYGALSESEGEVSVQWRRDADEIEILWKERGGPEPAANIKNGYGTKMIEAVLSHELRGSINRQFNKDGFSCVIRFSMMPSDTATQHTSKSVAQRGARVLLAEDSALPAAEIAKWLSQQGFQAIGPATTVAEALTLIDDLPDAALLDVDLHGEKIFPVAQRLREAGKPFAFLTGFSASDLPADFAGFQIFNKPFPHELVGDWLKRTLPSV